MQKFQNYRLLKKDILSSVKYTIYTNNIHIYLKSPHSSGIGAFIPYLQAVLGLYTLRSVTQYCLVKCRMSYLAFNIAEDIRSHYANNENEYGRFCVYDNTWQLAIQ